MSLTSMGGFLGGRLCVALGGGGAGALEDAAGAALEDAAGALEAAGADLVGDGAEAESASTVALAIGSAFVVGSSVAVGRPSKLGLSHASTVAPNAIIAAADRVPDIARARKLGATTSVVSPWM